MASAILHLYTEAARQSVGGQREVGGAGAEAVGGQRSLGYHLVVGVAQCQRQPFVGQCFLLVAMKHFVCNGGHMDGLSGTVDGTVGKQLCPLRPTVVVLIGEVPVIVFRRTSFVCRGVSIDIRRTLLVVLIGSLAFGIGLQPGKQLTAASVGIASQLYGSPLDGLSLNGIHHHVALTAVGQVLHQCSHIADKEKLARHLGSRRAFHLDEIDAHGKSLHLEGVIKQLVHLMTATRQRARNLRILGHMAFQFLIVLVIIRIQVGVAIHVDAIDTVRQLVDVTQLREFHGLCLSGHDHSRRQFRMELSRRHIALSISQLVYTVIAAPATDSIVQILPLLCGRSIGMGAHILIAVNSHLCHLRYVAVAVYQ